MVEQAPVATVIERLGRYDIEWLPVANAAARTWSDLAGHQIFAGAFSNVLRPEIGRAQAAVESTELAAESLSATPRGS